MDLWLGLQLADETFLGISWRVSFEFYVEEIVAVHTAEGLLFVELFDWLLNGWEDACLLFCFCEQFSLALKAVDFNLRLVSFVLGESSQKEPLLFHFLVRFRLIFFQEFRLQPLFRPDLGLISQCRIRVPKNLPNLLIGLDLQVLRPCHSSIQLVSRTLLIQRKLFLLDAYLDTWIMDKNSWFMFFVALGVYLYDTGGSFGLSWHIGF